MFTTRTESARCGVYLGIYYIVHAIFQGYMSLYFTSRGFNSADIGTIFALVALVSVFAQPVWGTLGDRMASRNRLLRILICASACVALAVKFADSLFLIVPLMCLYSWFYTSIQPLGDSIILDSLDKRNGKFGPIRLAGCLAFAVANTLLGKVLSGGREQYTIYLLIGVLLLTFGASYLLPVVHGGQKAGGRKMSFGALLKNRALMRLLIFTLPLHLTLGYFYTFFSPHFTSLPGGNGTLLGWCYFISATSELPFLLMSDRLVEKLGPGKLISIAAICLMGRWLIVGSTQNVVLVMLSQLFHSWTFIVMTVSMAKYVTRHVPEELRASGQMLIAIINFGIARVVGNLGGGLLADQIGRQDVFLINAAICLVTFLIFAPRYFRRGNNDPA